MGGLVGAATSYSPEASFSSGSRAYMQQGHDGHHAPRRLSEGTSYSTASVARAYSDHHRHSPSAELSGLRYPSVLQDHPAAHPAYPGQPTAAYSQGPERRAWSPCDADRPHSRPSYASQPVAS